MKKYCCEKFAIDVNLPSTTSPNIRIVQYRPNAQIGLPKYFGFYITTGYEKFNILLPKLNISYCPYCGKDLKKYYVDVDCLNEQEGITFD